jgi:MFS family permease
MIDEMMRELAIGAALIGNLSAFYFYTYAGLQVPVGLLIDRFGARRLMALAGLGCTLGCIVFAMSTGFWGIAVGRLLIGASAAFSFVSAMSVAGLWFPARRFALLSGLAMALGMLGGVLGQAPLRILVDAVDWRMATAWLALGGLAISALAIGTVRDRAEAMRPSGKLLAGLGVVARNPQTWIIAVAGLGTTAPLLGFAGLWGVPFFSAAYGLDRTAAASITSMMFIGWAIGAPVMGWLSDRIGRRKPPFIAGLALCAVSLAAVIHAPDLPLWGLMMLCLACGFGGSSQIVGFATAREHNPLGMSGTALGLVNGMVTGAGALYQPLVGWALDRTWTGTMVAGARVYDAASFRLALSVLIAGTFIGFLCTLAIRETHCRQVAVAAD